ncbi:hypothetical protein [Blastococcus litoris]|uniref:hypothetical protein n=1 Tax=Blastococcus litoris TaxID=2171622 RepID=UPI000E300589|nr:hypothetical protein [Blastococcus litoris]
MATLHSSGRPAPGRKGQRRRKVSRRPSRRRRPLEQLARTWWPALLVAAAVLVGVAWDSRSDMAGDGCRLPASGVTLTAEQIGNAQTIAQVGRDRGLPDRAIVIALATAQQESRLRNLDHGDRDSLGLFQQRPSQGWGSEDQVQDPVYAAGIFYDRLVQVPGWDTGRLTDVAQAVQRSGFPELYQQHEGMAVELTAALQQGRTPCAEV